MALCQECDHSCEVWFAPNDAWNAVMGGYEGHLCVRCFIAKAEAQGLNKDAWLVLPEPNGYAVVRFVDGTGWQVDETHLALGLNLAGGDRAR